MKGYRPDGETRLHDEDRERDSGKFHVTNLFDENADGREVDEGTGKSWDDTGGIGNDEKIRVVSSPNPAILKTPKEASDDERAEAWLKKNDPNYGEN